MINNASAPHAGSLIPSTHPGGELPGNVQSPDMKELSERKLERVRFEQSRRVALGTNDERLRIQELALYYSTVFDLL